MIRSVTSSYPTTALTHAGMSGKNNEDRFAVSAFRTEDGAPVLFAVLADGIGGHRAGEVAADMAVNQVSEWVSQSDGLDPLLALRMAFQAASDRIRDAAQQTLDRNGMGATCAAIWLCGYRLYIASVGDTRIYWIRHGHIQQLNVDHTWVQEALEAGLLAPSAAAGHPNAHVIRRYLGSALTPDVDLRLRLHDHDTGPEAIANQGFTLAQGDVLLICSDGLTDLVKDHEILAIAEGMEQKDACQALIDLANQRGGHDNITIIAVRIPRLKLPKPHSARTPMKRALLGCAGVLVTAALVIGIIGGWLWLRGRELSGSTPTPTAALAIKGTLPLLPPTGAVRATASLLPLPASATPTPRPEFLLPLVGGATYTPWPTHTLPPSATATPALPEVVETALP